MNRVIRLAVGAVLILAAGGAVSGQEPRNPTESPRSEAQRPANSGPAARTDDQGFINDLTIAGMAEVQLGKIAEQKAANADVKRFGRMMVTDHSQAGNELKAVASQLKVQPPTQLDPKHEELVDRLSKLQGAEFDREYMTAMVTGHEEVLGKLKARASTPDAAGAGQDAPHGAGVAKGSPEQTAAALEGSKGDATGKVRGADALTEWATKTMPQVQEHLDRAKQIQQQVAK